MGRSARGGGWPAAQPEQGLPREQSVPPEPEEEDGDEDYKASSCDSDGGDKEEYSTSKTTSEPSRSTGALPDALIGRYLLGEGGDTEPKRYINHLV